MKTELLGVGAFIRNNGEFLAVERKNDIYEGMLALPGGRVEPGEDAITALKREVIEETGYQVDILSEEPILSGELPVGELLFHLDIFRAEIVGERIEVQDDEVERVLWTEANDFLKSLVACGYPKTEILKMKKFLINEGIY